MVRIQKIQKENPKAVSGETAGDGAALAAATEQYKEEC